ncbi:aldose 1-epimerase family protein [Empedobacter sp.]|uniref:aldose 1-epimerase family protein n=1 Tax=Empedobacter sp. TaxID=1927715 RepID=UPI00289865E5|nr:aldose 1-epimerase family protein [Empedobacter sp.]
MKIENDFLRVEFSLKGAELKSIFSKKNKKEILWQADPKFWAKSSPILFPIVGALKNDKYTYLDKQYSLSRHGFARDMVFDKIEDNESKIIFSLKSNKDTIKIYPFQFDLQIIYSLESNRLNVDYIVKNLDKENDLLFSLGAHPAFNIEVNDDKNYSDYEIYFPSDEVLEINQLTNNLIAENKKIINLNNKKLDLSYQLFESDALVMTNLKSESLILRNKIDNDSLIFSFNNFPFFGIWAAKNANFVCLEPWSGIADFENHNQNLKQKIGILKLSSTENWKANWSIEIP